MRELAPGRVTVIADDPPIDPFEALLEGVRKVHAAVA